MLQRFRDKALQNFHTLKIREINKIIRELWQLIYKGQDIDSIEIESGQEEGATATKSSRSYNYRVVMRKGTPGLAVVNVCGQPLYPYAASGCTPEPLLTTWSPTGMRYR
jgi:hypothetical protein